jgi:hypothetical protein
MKTKQSVQVENKRMNGMLPSGCGFGDLRGSSISLEVFVSKAYIAEYVYGRTSCRSHGSCIVLMAVVVVVNVVVGTGRRKLSPRDGNLQRINENKIK